MEKPENYISCCGFYCKTCKEYVKGFCKGCKLGYDENERDINKAKCKIKLCSFKDKQLISCADCNDFRDCEILSKRFKPGTYYHRKCIGLLEYLKSNGSDNYIKIASGWNSHMGKIGS